MYHYSSTKNTYTFSSFQMTWNTNTQEQLKMSATTEQEVLNLYQRMWETMPSSSTVIQWEDDPTLLYTQMAHLQK